MQYFFPIHVSWIYVPWIFYFLTVSLLSALSETSLRCSLAASTKPSPIMQTIMAAAAVIAAAG